MDESHAGDIYAARRLRRDQQFRRAIKLARNNQALLIAAGKVFRAIPQAAVATERRSQRLRARVDRSCVEHAEVCEGRGRLATGDEIVSDRGGEAEAFLAAIGADIADPRGAEGGGGRSGEVDAVE